MSEKFDCIIKRVLCTDKIPKPSKKYKLVPGELKVSEPDKENFEMLYSPSGLKKSIGKGEIGLYWLFGEKSRQNENYHGADLILNNKYVEVKAYPLNKKMVTLGSIGEDKEMRFFINTLFGLNNIFGNIIKNDKPYFLSEVGFRTEDLVASIELYKKLENNISIIYNSINKYEIIKNINDSLLVINNVLKTLEINLEDNTDDIVVKILKRFIGRKLEKKPGWGQFIVNINPYDIFKCVFYQVPKKQELLNDNIEHYKKNYVVDFSRIRLNFSEFFK